MGKPNVSERILDQLDKAKRNGVENLESLYALADEVKALEAALRDIEDSPHKGYPFGEPFVSDSQTQYKRGIADGHRCAANRARAALHPENADG